MESKYPYYVVRGLAVTRQLMLCTRYVHVWNLLQQRITTYIIVNYITLLLYLLHTHHYQLLLLVLTFVYTYSVNISLYL